MTKEERKRRHLEGQRTDAIRALRSKLTTERMADKSTRDAVSAAMKKRWEDPASRARMLANRKKGPRIKDGLTKTERYRAKDVEAYRKLKREFARTSAERAKRVAYMRVWREKNRARHNELCRQSSKRNRHKHIEKNRDYHYRRQYGIGSKDKQAMVDAQGGACAICAQAFKSSRTTHIDHCHLTGAIRGILCNVCNTKLEWFETNGVSVVEYLAKHRQAKPVSTR